jgi:subtilisin family serine protease
MKKTIGILAIVAVLMIATVSFVSADTPTFVSGRTGLWFVEFHAAPTTFGTSESALAAERASFEAAATELGLDYTQRYSYTRLWNGISIAVDEAQLSTLRGMPEVKAVYPVNRVPIPEVPNENELELYTSKGMIGADIVNYEFGFTGKGVRVAVIDTGVDYHHPALRPCNNWLSCSTLPLFKPYYKGYDFVGDAFDGYNTPVPDSDPDDCNGHGTHVAGIIGANGEINGAEVQGVAPDVLFGAYRVFGCEGSTPDDIIIAAIEMAVADGADVINMSIGGAYDWPGTPLGAASTAAVDAGVVVVASAGNYSEDGLYAAHTPALGEGVVGVASFDNVKVHMPYASVDFVAPNVPDAVKIPWAYLEFSESAPADGTVEFIVPILGDGCASVPSTVAGKLALIRRGACSFSTKVANAMAQGATGVVISNYSGWGVLTNGTLGAPMPGSGPVVGIDFDDGAYIESLVGMDPTWKWTGKFSEFISPTGGLISSFSQYGPSPDLDLYPNVGAPGGGIWSTLPMEQGGWGLMSGTSMSSPHVAGAAALLLDAFPYDLAEVRAKLMNSAQPKHWSLDPGFGKAEPTYRQGSGLIQVQNSVNSKVTFMPDSLNLGESVAGPQTRTIMVTNNSRNPVYYNIRKLSAIAAEGYTHPVDWHVTDERLIADDCAVPPMTTVGCDVTIEPPTNAPVRTLYNGWVIFEPVITPETFEEAQTYRVPYVGFVGDYQYDMSHIYEPYFGMPWLTDKNWTPYFSDGHVFTMVQWNDPTLLFHFYHQVPQMYVEVINAQTGRMVRQNNSLAFDVSLIDRDWEAGGVASIHVFEWDGTRMIGDLYWPVKDGAYQLRVKALKALGDPADMSHWEFWQSPMFWIDRGMAP